MARAPPVAITSYPGMAAMREAEGPKTHNDADFTWMEDPLLGWEAVAVFGGLLVCEGLVLRWALTQSTYYFVPVFNGGPFIGFSALLYLGCLPAAFWGYTELALGFAGAASAGVAIGVFCPLPAIPPGYPLVAVPGPYLTDFLLILGLLGVGAAILVLGVVQSIRANRTISEDD
jgi:hypothetical protein